jgi:hypothetical protein
MSAPTSRGDLIKRLVAGGFNKGTDRYPRASIRLGPWWGVVRPIHFVAAVTPWPQELDGLDFTVLDSALETPWSAQEDGLGDERRAAVSSRLDQISRALGVRVVVEFQRGEGVVLQPDSAPAPFDHRDELHLEDLQIQLAQQKAKQHEQERWSIAKLALGELMGDEGGGGL